MTVGSAFLNLLSHPAQLLIQRWNWKAAIFSAFFRGVIFFLANLSAGWEAAAGAMLAESLYRCCAAGFYGALTQAFRSVEPAWHAVLTVMILLPLAAHSLEFVIHWLRETPNLYTSILASACFTVLSTLFNLYAMRRGVLLVGVEGRPLREDIQRFPRMVVGFIVFGPRWMWRRIVRAS